jgi:hypothetical protein
VLIHEEKLGVILVVCHAFEKLGCFLVKGIGVALSVELVKSLVDESVFAVGNVSPNEIYHENITTYYNKKGGDATAENKCVNTAAKEGNNYCRDYLVISDPAGQLF